MKKLDMLPVIAAFVIALLILPTLALPVNAVTPTTGNLASVVTIAEDDLVRNTGVMVLGLTPTTNTISTAGGWFTDSLCSTPVTGTTTVGPELTSEPISTPASVGTWYQRLTAYTCVAHSFAPVWPLAQQTGFELLSQHKILATLNGVPTKPDYVLCEIVEKEKAKIPPPTSKSPTKRQFPDEILKTTLQDVTSNFVCKFRWLKPGVGALDVYFVGPRVKNFIADHMLIVTVGYKVGRNTIWASDLQDICILGWSMGNNVLGIDLFSNPGLSTFPSGWERYWSWDDAIGKFVSCDEAAAWQRAWIGGGWPYSTN